MRRKLVTLNDDPIVDGTREPTFRFHTEVDALEMVERLDEELRIAREQEHHTLRYLAAAVRAAGQFREDGKKIRPQAIINHSRVARRTIYKWLGERE